jgi:hypothetical protein
VTRSDLADQFKDISSCGHGVLTAGAHIVQRDKRGDPRPLNSHRNQGEPMTLKMMMKCCLASAAAMTLVIATLPAMAYTGQELSKQAKVSITEARAIALKAHPGKITDEELEKEKGGTGLRYSFDIRSGAVTQEVGVDAQTGKVLENKKEGPHPD